MKHQAARLPSINRRALLIGTAAGGGLLVAWKFWPHHAPHLLKLRPGETAFGAWLTIDRQGVIIVSVPQLEMGQGISTLLAQIVAAELGADWRQIAVQPAPVSNIWPNAPLAVRWAELWCAFPDLAQDADGWLARRWAKAHSLMITADGTSISAYENPAREAAASARALLAMAAAERWRAEDIHADWQQCDVSGGMVRLKDKTLSFGALADEASRFTPPDPPQLLPSPVSEPPSSFPIGTPAAFPRLDIPAKLDGSFPFAGDVRLPGMVFAAIRHAPIAAGVAPLIIDTKYARAIMGFDRVVTFDGWLAAVGSTWWAAEQALRLISAHFDPANAADTTAIESALDKALHQGKAQTIAAIGDIASTLGKAPMSQRYDIAPALHASLETATATVRISRKGWMGQRVEIWIATQAPEITRHAVAEALGLSDEDVVLIPMAAGGSFDARLETPHAVQAALIAREISAPVQLIWPRAQEMLGGTVRPPLAAQVSATLAHDGTILAWKMKAALPAAAREFGHRLLGGQSRATAMARAGDEADPLALEGALPPYTITNVSIEHIPVAVGLPSGRLRGNAHGYTAFITECFIDEIATSLKREPLSFRMAMLDDEPRLAQCLQRVSTLAGWNGSADGSGNGLACHRMGDSVSGGCIAAIATARRVANSNDSRNAKGGVRVDRIVAVVDIGRIINVDIARQQIEGGLIFGLGLALGSSTSYAQGQPLITDLAGLSLPVLANCPDIVVEFMTSNAAPFDPGELGVAVVAPAIANALASATGNRFRNLPLLNGED